MATTGEKYPTLAVTAAESPWIDNDWTTPTNVYSDNAATANVTATSFDSPDQTYVLKATGFDFSSIPDGSTILGVTCRVNAWYRSGQGAGSMDLMQLLDVSKAKVGTNQCATPVALTTVNTTIITKGGAADLWGNALTAAWVKDPDFGVALGILATAANADVDIDYVTLEIEYTPPPTRRGQVSWAEMELPAAPRKGQVSWAELELPNALRKGQLSWAEFEVPDATTDRKGRLSWAELELPEGGRRGQVSWSELEIPDYDKRGQISWAELEVPTPPNFVLYGAPFKYESANWGAVNFYFEVYMRATTGSVYARLYNVTTDSAVPDSLLSTVLTSLVRLRSGAITLTNTHEYRVQFGKSGSDAGEFLGGKIVVV
jgi:hypothetical protein